MFYKQKSEPTTLETVIDEKLIELKKYDIADKAFADATDQITKLHKLKTADGPQRVSPDVLVNAAATIATVVMIIKHEQFNVIASKALSFVPKPR